MAKTEWEKMAEAAAAKYGIPPNIYKALIGRESAWNPMAGSSKGAAGLVQIHLPSHPDVTLQQAQNPAFALDWGARYLASQYKQFGNWRLALAAYNAGPSAVTSGAWKGYSETTSYVSNVLADAGILVKNAGSGAHALGADVSRSAPVGYAPVADAARETLREIAAGNFNALRSFSRLRDAARAPVRIQEPIASSKGVQGALDVRAAPGALGSALKAAMSQLGKPYVWGGEEPEEGGFDCSGLIDWALRQAGVDFPGRLTTYTIAKLGTSVRGGSYRPGDMILSNNGEHVTWYIGNGKVIAAPRRGEAVQIQDVPDGVVDVRRINTNPKPPKGGR